MACSRRSSAAGSILTRGDFSRAFNDLGLTAEDRVIAHASLSAFGTVVGGPEAIVSAILSSIEAVIMPAFTYRTMVIPAVGPKDNGIDYARGGDQSRMAEFFRVDMPADASMGAIAERLRLHPEARRSPHPILSFSGVHAEAALASQSLDEPLAPIASLADAGGKVLLLGVDHRANTSIHHAERLAARRQFVRWALTPSGVVECAGWPGCSDGFQAIQARLKGIALRARLGPAEIQVMPLRDLVHLVKGWIKEDPRALLCSRLGCPRCSVVRASVRVSG